MNALLRTYLACCLLLWSEASSAVDVGPYLNSPEALCGSLWLGAKASANQWPKVQAELSRLQKASPFTRKADEFLSPQSRLVPLASQMVVGESNIKNAVHNILGANREITEAAAFYPVRGHRLRWLGSWLSIVSIPLAAYTGYLGSPAMWLFAATSVLGFPVVDYGPRGLIDANNGSLSEFEAIYRNFQRRDIQGATWSHRVRLRKALLKDFSQFGYRPHILALSISERRRAWAIRSRPEGVDLTSDPHLNLPPSEVNADWPEYVSLQIDAILSHNVFKVPQFILIISEIKPEDSSSQ